MLARPEGNECVANKQNAEETTQTSACGVSTLVQPELLALTPVLLITPLKFTVGNKSTYSMQFCKQETCL